MSTSRLINSDDGGSSRSGSGTLRGHSPRTRWYLAGVRSTWPALVAVVAVGTVIGISIGGLPASRAGEVDLSAATTTAFVPPLDTSPWATAPASTTAATAPQTAPTTTTAVAASPVTTTTPAAVQPLPETTTGTTGITVTTGTSVVPDVAPLLDRAAVRVVLANGDGRFNLVGINADRILPLGYLTIAQTDLSESGRVARTTIYFRDGFDGEARRLAEDLLVPAALLEPLGDRTATNADASGDVIALLGPDAVR